MLYDGGVYVDTSRKGATIASIPDRDVFRLNLLQAVGADENVFFSDWAQVEEVKRIVAMAKRHRTDDAVRLNEAVEIGNPNVSLVHVYEEMPNILVDLSILEVKKSARRVPLASRLVVRDEVKPTMDALEPAPRVTHGQGGRRTYKVTRRC
jgi:hypothetical protein